jgi:hypothetical protein
MSSQTPNPDRKRNVINMTLAVFAGQVGCVTLLILAVTLLGGSALDSWLNTKPWITVALVVISVPLSLYLMFQLSAKAIAKIQASAPEQKTTPEKEENLGGKDS